jgi:hypothetical protein
MRVFLSGFESDQKAQLINGLLAWAIHFGVPTELVDSVAESDVIVLDSDRPVFETLDPNKRTLTFGHSRIFGVREHHPKPIRSFQLAAALYQ